MITNLTLFTVLMQIASVDGQVRDALTRKPLELVRVELTHLGVPTASEYTDAEGRFRFANLAPGRYTVSAGGPGYEYTTAEIDTSGRNFVELEIPKVVKRKQRVSDSASVLNEMGNRYRKRDDFQRAETSFKRAMELSDSPYIALNLAEVYTAQNRFAEAEAVLESAIHRTPRNGDAYYGLALVYFEEGRLENAESAAVQADSYPHRVADLHLLLAKIYERLNPEKVGEQLRLYLKEAPNGPLSERIRQTFRPAAIR
jgi:tetratricopeptide (TPR) repeat protein